MTFDSVNVLVFEVNPLIRRAIKDALSTIGVSEIVTVGTAPDFEDGLGQGMPDLVICDGSLAGSAAVGMVRDLRHGRLGDNPFSAVLTTAETPTLTLVKQVMNSGTDALLSKPLSVQSVIERVRGVTFRRRPFAVTEEYIGPVRGPGRRRARAAGLVDVPNTLRDKLEGTYDHARARQEIREARALVDEQKASQGALLITSLARDVARAAGEIAPEFPMAARLTRLKATTEDIYRRLASAGEPEVASLCRSLLKVIAKAQAEQAAPDLKDIDLLQNLAHAIHMAYRPDARIAKFAANISTAIQGARRYRGL